MALAKKLKVDMVAVAPDDPLVLGMEMCIRDRDKALQDKLAAL